MDARYAWEIMGTRGEGVRIVVLEFNARTTHADLPPITILPFGHPFDGAEDHGTAVFGIMGMIPDNGFGGNGIAPDAEYYLGYVFNGPNYNTDFDLLGAMSAALDVLRPGDILLIEVSIAGPGADPTTQFGYVSVEWWKPAYDMIRSMTANGIIVVNPAANGQRNLDHSDFNVGHAPYRPENSSGSIHVGGSRSSPNTLGSDVVRSKTPTSNYGSIVVLQGYGERVYTAGYGPESPRGGESSTPAHPDYHFTWNFGGTSAAAPKVAGIIALLQSAHMQATGGEMLSPEAITRILQETGSLQNDSATFPAANFPIGPLPDMRAALNSLWPTWSYIYMPEGTTAEADANNNGIPNFLEFAMGGDPRSNTSNPVYEFSLHTAENQRFPQLSYSRRIPDPGFTVRVQRSFDLVNWETLDENILTVGEPVFNGEKMVSTIRLQQPVESGSPVFLRVTADGVN